MDEQTTPTTEPVTIPPDLVTPPAGEASASIPTTEPNNVLVEPPQTESPQPQAEPVPAPETAQNEPVPEPVQTPPESQTAQLAGNEPLPVSVPEPVPNVEAPILNREDVAGREAETPQVETPVSPVTPITNASASEETPPKTEESPPTPPVAQQGTAQPEPPPPASPMPAQAPVVSSTQTSRSIVRLLFEKAKLTIQLRKQKKYLKIMELLTKKGKITNDDVQKLLRVSDATATRYLSELEKQGKISQTGKTGRSVTYTKR